MSMIPLEVKNNMNSQESTIFPVLVFDEADMLLIDCGFPNFLELIEESAKSQGVDLTKLTKIIITHHDYDHMGSLAAFKRKYPRIQVYTSEIQEEYVSGKKKFIRLEIAELRHHTLSEAEKANASSYNNKLKSVETVRVDQCLQDKESFDWCGGVEIIMTPGHMPGHISVYLKESKTLVTGDALTIENGQLCSANPIFTLDMQEAKTSAKKFLSYDIENIVCYHGGICTKDIKNSLLNVIEEW